MSGNNFTGIAMIHGKLFQDTLFVYRNHRTDIFISSMLVVHNCICCPWITGVIYKYEEIFNANTLWNGSGEC